jgi:hypothetical protein
MAMSADTIIGLVALLIMCFPALLFLLRIARRYRSGNILPSTPGSRLPLARVASDELSLVENGMVYAAVSAPNILLCGNFELTGVNRNESNEEKPL